jgi:hypothetical protein
MYVYIKKVDKRIKDRIFFYQKGSYIKRKKRKVTVWFWMAGRNYKGKLKTKKGEKKRYIGLSYIFAF